jgi:hypothetical protein
MIRITEYDDQGRWCYDCSQRTAPPNDGCVRHRKIWKTRHEASQLRTAEAFSTGLLSADPLVVQAYIEALQQRVDSGAALDRTSLIHSLTALLRNRELPKRDYPPQYAVYRRAAAWLRIRLMRTVRDLAVRNDSPLPASWDEVAEGALFDLDRPFSDDPSMAEISSLEVSADAGKTLEICGWTMPYQVNDKGAPAGEMLRQAVHIHDALAASARIRERTSSRVDLNPWDAAHLRQLVVDIALVNSARTQGASPLSWAPEAKAILLQRIASLEGHDKDDACGALRAVYVAIDCGATDSLLFDAAIQKIQALEERKPD